MFRQYVLPYIVFLIYKALWLTWKIEFIEPDEMKKAMSDKRSMILAHWHGDEMGLMHIGRRYNLATIVSTSKDGEIMNRVLALTGVPTSRGSSTRGGVGALKGLIGLMKKGYSCSFAVDGPKGPIYVAKPGVFEVSRILNAPIFCAGVACDKKKVFERAWNKGFLPLPFAKLVIKWEPFPEITKEMDPRDEGLARQIEATLHRARDAAYKAIAT